MEIEFSTLLITIIVAAGVYFLISSFKGKSAASGSTSAGAGGKKYVSALCATLAESWCRDKVESKESKTSDDDVSRALLSPVSSCDTRTVCRNVCQ